MDITKLKTSIGNPLVLGATIEKGAINFSILNHMHEECSVILYKIDTKDIVGEIKFTNAMLFGDIHAMKVYGLEVENYDYNFRIGDEIVVDRYAKYIKDTSVWGKLPDEPITSAFIKQSFDWDSDAYLRIPYEDTIIYRLHVRGFTKDKSSKAKFKGTFKGVLEKLDYLKELGITMVELMPAYDFREVSIPKQNSPHNYKHDYTDDNYPINFWGYTDANYFVPKSSYSYNDDAVAEFKEFVQIMHNNGIEVGMEFYFNNEVETRFVLECIRYWVLEYHIDAVHISSTDEVMNMLEQDPILTNTKLIGWGFKGRRKKSVNDNKNVASFSESFMVNARRFLKGDEDQVAAMTLNMRNNPPEKAIINFISNHNTFTLMDLVSYDRKHNDLNGESNKDGAEYNYSWNCGVEGTTKKKKVLDLRLQQIKNALSFVFFSQGVPMIFAGDEFGNSADGNNNPYCQDNSIGWINWKQTKLSKEILEFVKQLIAIKKSYPILSMKDQMRIMDYKSLGLPDISYHGSKPWYADFNNVNRHFSVMYCGKYANEDCPDIYIAYNMHWESQKFGLPAALGKRKWKSLLSTGKEADIDQNKCVTVQPRTVVVLLSE